MFQGPPNIFHSRVVCLKMFMHLKCVDFAKFDLAKLYLVHFIIVSGGSENRERPHQSEGGGAGWLSGPVQN